ncbi:MAG: helix-turn-helix transcriptional regulator [Alphaproteobacteria bacterium]|nr:helix-turn-helix transcriptional regulator [Alphaproteobacteria bacterium]
MILANELMGRIVAILRRRLDMSQRRFAQELDWPQGLVSKVERGDVSITWDQVDAIAAVLSRVEEERRGRKASIGWATWELFRLADLTADALDDAGFRIVWRTERLINDPTRYVRAEELEDRILDVWAEEYRDRL